MGFFKKAVDAAFGGSGPKYSASKGAAQHAGDTRTSLGNIIKTPNADGSIDTVFEDSAIDQQRNALALQGLNGMSLNPSAVQQAYYDQATRLLNKNYQQNVDATDERLINRGIQTGTKQYNDVMGNMQDSYQGTLNDMANQAMYMGQSNLGQQIGNINSLTGGRDINTLAGIGTADSDAYDNAYQGSVYNNAMRNERNANIMGTIGTIAGMGASAAGLFSDERLKENLKKVGALTNGLNVYVGNYKKETGMDTRPQLFLLAQEVKEKHPSAVGRRFGALTVDYSKAVK